MKKYLLLIIATLVLVSNTIAQQPAEKRLEAIKIAYITQQLALTPEEAQTFWPVFNKYEGEVKVVRDTYKNDEVEFQSAAVNIAKKYKGEFKKILRDDIRVNQTFKIHIGYNKLLREELQRRRELRQNKPKRF
jgi:Skp family chaperone for outer membrane proteins